MLERLAAQFLNKYIGQYVENFNPQNLSIGVVQGAVELEGLYIRKDALKNFDLPGIAVKWGYIGNITLRIPSYRNYSEPWVIDVNKLYLIVGPSEKDENDYDEESEQLIKKEKKAVKLAELEEKWQATQATSKSIYAIWRSYSSSIVTNIVENLQIRLFDMHIRYEDSLTLPESFAFGMHIDVLCTETTDETWNPKASSKPNAEKKWKKMDLKELSFYWDTKSTILEGMTQAELLEAMATSVGRSEEPAKQEHFILCPVSGEARLTRVCSTIPLRSKKTPRLALDVDLPEISLNLTKHQYNQLLSLSGEVARWDTRKQHGRGRPQTSICEDASAWWKWVINKQIEKVQLKRKQRSMEFVLKRAQLIVGYVKSYKDYLNAKYGNKSLEKHVETALEEMRLEMSFPELAILHELVYNEIDEETRKKRETDQVKLSGKAKARAKKRESKKSVPTWRWGGWLGKWRNRTEVEAEAISELSVDTDSDSYAADESLSSDVDQTVEAVMPDSVFKDLNDDEIFEMFGDELSDEDTTDTFLRRDAVLLKLNFILNSGKLTLLQADRSVGLVSLEFKDVEIKSEWRPRYGTHEVTLDLGSINLRDLNPLNTHFCDLVKPSTRKQRPSSPPVNLPADAKEQKKTNDSWAGFFTFNTSKTSDTSIQDDYEKRENAPVLSVTYEKLPAIRTHQFSDRLEVITAPLCLTVLPGLTDRLKRFFKTPSENRLTQKGMKNKVLTDAAQEKYDLWMMQARAEVTSTVKRLMEGKAAAKVSKDKWAVTLDIFAPDIIIPEDWSNSNCSVVVLSLGHMTFANHAGDVALEEYINRAQQDNPQQEDFESDDDDYLTPPNTPPTVSDDKHSMPPDDVLPGNVGNETMHNNFIDQEFLTERMLWDKMYERYHVRFADLQVLVATNRAKWDAYRVGAKTPLHLIERFSVELTAERRVVPTTDPNYPALLLTGNLPHLTIHLSHKKVHTVIKCIDQLSRKTPLNVPAYLLGHDPGTPPKQTSVKTKLLPRPEKTINLARANSIQLVCDFLINQVSVVLEEQRENQIISVLEISQIQTKFVEKPYDSTVSFSIYSLLLVDVMQQLGHDYELLLASHRSVYMDVDSGNILDSGTVSPENHSRSSANLQSPPNSVKRCASDSSRVGGVPTTNVLSKVAENLRQFARLPTLYGSKTDRSKSAAVNPETFQYLITLKIQMLRRDTSPLRSSLSPLSMDSKDSVYPYTDVKANFSNLDVVFNAKSWVTILNFLYKLKKPATAPNTSVNLHEAGVFEESQHERLLRPKRSVMHFGVNQSDLEEKTKRVSVNINFKKLNILLMRHIVKFDTPIGRKLATITMQGAHVETSFEPQNDSTHQSSDLKVDVAGSIASLQMQDLTSAKILSTSHGYEILSVGMQDLLPSPAQSSTESSKTRRFSEDQMQALSFCFKQMVTKSSWERSSSVKEKACTSVSAPSIPVTHRTEHQDTDNIVSDTMLFKMDAEDARYFKKKFSPAFKTETRVDMRLASACYIHSPRLVAEVLAWSDEVGDFAQAKMTTATRQAYKDMAKSIMDKVSDYSKSFVGKNTDHDSPTLDGSYISHTDGTPTTKSSSVQPSNAELHFQLKMESPILAFPKSPGSFELLVANLGQITVQNEINSSSGPLDKLHIDVENMNLRSHRQRAEELEAKKATESLMKVSSGPNITKLKQDSLDYLYTSIDSARKNSTTGSQILHNTFLRLTVERKEFIPSPKSPLDVRHCCSSETLSQCSRNSSCDHFISHVGPIADTRMCIAVQAASALTVTLSKQAYEQVLKTLDNISYGGDIDAAADVMFASQRNAIPVQQSASAPDLFNIKAKHQKFPKTKVPNLSSSSYQSTPKPDKEPSLFNVPELEEPKQSPIFNLQNTSIRKYTPISANISVPCLIFQLSGDLSEGEQGIVKVTLERFTGAYKKENRFGTEIDLSLGSVDIEDLLQNEDSPDRHIVVSFQADQKSSPDHLKTVYLSASCPAFIKPTVESSCCMSASLPSFQQDEYVARKIPQRRQSRGLFRPYDSIHVARNEEVAAESQSQPASPRLDADEKKTDVASGQNPSGRDSESEAYDSTLVKIMAYMVDGNSAAYSDVYDRVNRNIDVDFNSLDCKVNLQTWVVLLDFFGIGTSPKKQYQLDPKTEKLFSDNQQLDVRSFYENQPQEMINSKINFSVCSFALTLNKQEYELLKANVAGLQSDIQIRDAMLRVSGQLGGLSVSDLSPNGSLYRERFIFTGDKALDFDIKKFDEYDQHLEREFDISVRLRMSSIRYVHTQRFQNETVAYCQHFQQLQEVLGRMRAASVGQSVHPTSRRQARVLLDVEADAPIILIPESSHSNRLLVANLGHITVANEFKYDKAPGTLSYQAPGQSASRDVDQPLIDLTDKDDHCLLDVFHVDLIDMDLFTATYSKNSRKATGNSSTHDFELIFPSYVVTCNSRPLLKEKVKLELQMERNLEKDLKHNGVPDTALSARLSSVYCAINHQQFWLIRGVLDHNAGETIPDFPQPTAFLQPSKEQTVLTGKVFTGLSMDFYLTNVSIELLRANTKQQKSALSLGRLDFVKSRLSYRAYSDNNKTTNLSCQSFRAHDTRFQGGQTGSARAPSVFTTILGEKKSKDRSVKSSATSLLQFELFQRTGPGFVEFTALLNNMRVYLILDWLTDTSKYLLENPDQERCDALRAKTAQLMNQFNQVQSGNQQQKLDSSGQLLPEEQSKKVKMNFTNTEFVLVEDATRLESDGVILRSTAVFDYFPDRNSVIKPPGNLASNPLLSCSLQSLEVFSCQLNQENETALSIIDPVTINFEVRPIKQTDLSKEEIQTDASILDKTLLDIQVSQLNIRVSYNDVMMFLNIFKSITGKTNLKGKGTGSHAASSPSKVTRSSQEPSNKLIEPLIDIGYSRSDVIQALSRNENNIQRAGSWLVEHAQLEQRRSTISKNSNFSPKSVPLDLARLRLSADVLRICLIDDCAEDCDVPLTEMAIRNLTVRQEFAYTMTSSYKELLFGQMGSATFNLSGDYYNRMLSLWEPFLEPWRCNVAWRHLRSKSETSPGSWNFEMQASDRFDVTVTSALMETVKMTTTTWRKDYAAIADMKTVSLARKRLPLVAYVLRNLTGSPLKFATQTAAMHEGNNPEEIRQSRNDVAHWLEVLPGEDCSFNFATMHEKQRHKRSESLKLHQIIVQVDEWKMFQPVTVSKVGVYFRHAFKQISKSSSIYEPSVPVRVVFSVTLEGNAQKVVTVRSALAVRSRVKIPVQLQLYLPNSKITLPALNPGETHYVPLSLTPYPIRIRPSITSHSIPCTYEYSSTAIQWMLAMDDKKEESQLIECESSQPNQPKFFFAVCTQRLPYPSYEDVCEMLSQQDDDHVDSDWEGCLPSLPGHTIVILPPVVISNLLPCDLRYYIKNRDVEGTLKPGIDATPHGVHVSPSDQTSIIVGCLIDGFQSCRELIVPAIAKNFQMRMLIKDWNNETLILNVRVLWRLGCSVKISVMAGYWIVNKTGLPIVMKQEGSNRLAAGQYDTHEQARSLQPLLFSYANREAPYLCTMRLGKKAQIEDYLSDGLTHLRGTPSFCERFSTDGGSCTRNLKLITSDGTPNREFCIGVSVRRGWGRYLHTHIVTIAPRFLLVNRTQNHRLSFAQRHTISYIADSSGIGCHLTIIPGSSCVFHWPRVDLDTLLCVRMADLSSCHWSGGFFIDRTDAFHIALRLAPASPALRHALSPHCVFLIVEVTLVNATYCVVVSDADPSQIPPPLRIDNVSYAPIIFKQVGADASYNTEVAAESQLAYACDEPCLPQHISCSVRGDSSHIDVDMNVIGEEKQLYYKNYFYIAMGVVPHQTTGSDHLSHMILVLDVQKNQKLYDISLQPLRSGKRSQLWRMNNDGRIFHEGSSPPENNTLSAHNDSSHHRSTGLVLDIAEMAVNVGRSFDQGIPLTLKPPDERRRSTQTWSFDDDRRLKCRHRGLAVQVDRLATDRAVVLALFDDRRVCLPTEMCTLQKLIPGSGCLCLKVVRDGPTRVLRIVDIRQKRLGISSGSNSWTMLETAPQNSLQGDSSTAPSGDSPTYNLSVSMPQGVGISLISNSSEELLYLTMSGVNVHISADDSEQLFSLTMQKFQIDNQLLDAYPPVLLAPCLEYKQQKPSGTTANFTKPLVSINAVRQPTSSRMYEIYKSFVVDLGKLSISLEEKLILKLLYFMGYNPLPSEKESELLDETKLDSATSWTNLRQTSYTTVKRFYFDTMRLSAAPMRLSVFTASRLSPELKAVKQTLAVPLIQFERAPVALQDYVKRHLFETLSFVMADLSKHLREQLKSQAAIILGSIDFLGNPIGLMSDVRAGIHAGLGHGNVQNMTKHITHGLSNTTAKFTGALSDKIGGLAMDDEYEDKRKAIQANARSSAGGHVVAGLQGFMAGVVGGLTSVVTQPVKGAQSDGASGFFKGVLKGVVGTVTKPVTGVLDLASESASAVRHMSVSPDRIESRARPIRCCHSFQGCLQYYSKYQADGQTFLYALNSNDYSEHFYSVDNLNNILVLITNKKVYFVKNREPDIENIILVVDYPDLVGATVISSSKQQTISSKTDFGTGIFLELTMKLQTPNPGGYSYNPTGGVRYHTKKPRIACQSLSVAERVCWQIRYAKNLASEQTETMQSGPDEEKAQDRAFELEV